MKTTTNTKTMKTTTKTNTKTKTATTNTTDIQVGDKVYWKKNTGVFIHTLSGTVMEIDLEDYTAVVKVNTQKIWGRLDNVHLSKLTKNKKQ